MLWILVLWTTVSLCCQAIEPGPAVIATKGAVWPRPQHQHYYSQVLNVHPNQLSIQVTSHNCDIIQAAITRYEAILKKLERTVKRAWYLHRKRPRHYFSTNPHLTQLNLTLGSPCQSQPSVDMKEDYELRVNSPDAPGVALVSSQSVWGILRGLETFAQLVYLDSHSTQLQINSTMVIDYPKFGHRGLLVDTARHFLPMKVLISLLDGMAANKLNVFHWHITDDQSFPYESIKYPLLVNGAYSRLHTYSQQDVASVLETARLRGIRVIPEFDSPGHTRSWGVGYPELLTPCYDKNGRQDNTLGPMNPINGITYTLMAGLLDEISKVFPDAFLHLGGDEVPFECWESNPQLTEYMRAHNLTSAQLEEMYMQRVLQMSQQLNKSAIVWQEVVDNGVNIPLTTVVHVWKDWTDYRAELAKVTSMGLRVLLSACWYLDHLSTGGDWLSFYRCNPTDFSGTASQKELVLGGEACMWAEVVDSTNIQARVWPRASAAAERLWTGAAQDETVAAARLEEHVCRMNMRGLKAQPPNGPGFCPYQLYN